MKITFETIKVVSGVKACVVKLHGVVIIKYAELTDGRIRLLWVMSDPGADRLQKAIDDVLAYFDALELMEA
jgi:hypothetical protein